MRKSVAEYVEKLETLDLSIEYACVNSIQKTPWQINGFVCDVIRAAWDSGQQYVGLPPRENTPLPEYPFDIDPSQFTEEQKKEFKDFKIRRGAIHNANCRSMSRRIQVERTLQLAEEYRSIEKFFYVWQLDFRGRKYPVESFLSPQNADYSKALLEFSNPVFIKDDSDAQWLAIHGANVFGVDKVSLEDREMWAYLNVENAVAVYNDPLGCKWWQEADKPWQALAWCKEWAEYNEVRLRGMGEFYETRLPCASDGSCNGLQHLSAMLRDSEGGRSVNLTPSDEPQDIYTDVAERTTKFLEQQDTEVARQLLRVGICRKICKRSVMIVPYSGTRHACRSYIQEALAEKCSDFNPFGDSLFQASNYLAGFVWQAIAEVIKSASIVMSYIKSIAQLYVEADIPLQWTTPTGLLIVQNYAEVKSRRIKTHLNGSLLKLNYNEKVDRTINTRKTISGSSPNFIHSLDAAALTLTVNHCVELGITDFAMVHDSYGTHSPNMPLLNKVLREEFVSMYEKNDVLQNLYDTAVASLPEGVDVPPPPTKGDLDIQEVLQSDYFFA